MKARRLFRVSTMLVGPEDRTFLEVSSGTIIVQWATHSNNMPVLYVQVDVLCVLKVRHRRRGRDWGRSLVYTAVHVQ